MHQRQNPLESTSKVLFIILQDSKPIHEREATLHVDTFHEL
jgi:hypothetical protein